VYYKFACVYNNPTWIILKAIMQQAFYAEAARCGTHLDKKETKFFTSQKK